MPSHTRACVVREDACVHVCVWKREGAFVHVWETGGRGSINTTTSWIPREPNIVNVNKRTSWSDCAHAPSDQSVSCLHISYKIPFLVNWVVKIPMTQASEREMRQYRVSPVNWMTINSVSVLRADADIYTLYEPKWQTITAALDSNKGKYIKDIYSDEAKNTQAPSYLKTRETKWAYITHLSLTMSFFIL